MRWPCPDLTAQPPCGSTPAAAGAPVCGQPSGLPLRLCCCLSQDGQDGRHLAVVWRQAGSRHRHQHCEGTAHRLRLLPVAQEPACPQAAAAGGGASSSKGACIGEALLLLRTATVRCQRRLFIHTCAPPPSEFCILTRRPTNLLLCPICTAHHLHCPCRPHPAPKLHFCPCTSCSRAAAPCSFILITSTHCLCFLVKTFFKVEQSAVRVLQEAVPPRVLPRVSHPSGLRFCVLGTVRVRMVPCCLGMQFGGGPPRASEARGPALSSPYSPR